MNSEANTGLKMNATNSDPAKVTETVMGRYFMKLPMMPGIQRIGRNADTVVRVAVATGSVTSLVPSMAAWNRVLPIDKCR